MTLVVKLGGSVVTEKSSPETVDEAALERAAAALGDYDGDLVVVHGGGSFGHTAASRHGVSRTEGTADAAAVRDVHAAMKRLDAAVVDALAGAGVPAVPVHPLSVAHRDTTGSLSLPVGAVRTALGEGFVPVLHGDVVAHEGAGATVLSGDELVVSLGDSLAADRVGVCSTVPGVLDGERVVPEIMALEEVADLLGASEDTDVTGGMAGKVESLLALSTPAAIFGLDDLPAFLAGERVGTRIP